MAHHGTQSLLGEDAGADVTVVDFCECALMGAMQIQPLLLCVLSKCHVHGQPGDEDGAGERQHNYQAKP